MFKPGDIVNQRYRILRQVAMGGFSIIFEVRDLRQRNFKNAFGLRRSRSIKILKVLNCSDSSRKDAEFLFRRETGILQKLNHPQIVHYCDSFDHIDRDVTLPCLVLEKVTGQTLELWLKENGSASELQVLDWLAQFMEVLDYLHNDQHMMHLDIKPANVIITPKNQLVLIDFGIARPISQTLLAKLVDEGESTNHRAGTTWYMAPEQAAGKPTTQSDIYAVGRTLIQAIANRPPCEIPQDDEGDWDWEAIASHLSPETHRLLTNMTTYSLTCRLTNPEAIFQQVKAIYGQYFSKTKTPRYQVAKFTRNVVLPSAIATGLVVGLRFLGALQLLELQFYDHTLRMRPDIDGPDPNITIINISNDDVEYQRRSNPRMPKDISIDDETLKKLVEKIKSYDPKVIGIDIFGRDISGISGRNIIIGNCVLGNPGEVAHQEEPTIGVHHNNLGFVDVVYDGDEISKMVRRQQIIRRDRSHCRTNWSFAYRIAYRYFQPDSSMSPTRLDAPLLNKKIIKKLESYNFAYASFEDQGYQSLIYYRTHPDASESYSLQSVLEETDSKVLENIFADKVVLIGTIAFTDFHDTPYGKKSGIIIHAHMISHFLDVALGKRKDLFFFSYLESFIYVMLCCLFYGFLIAQITQIKMLFKYIFSLALVLYISSVIAGSNAILIPFVPVILAWFLQSMITIYFCRNKAMVWRLSRA